VRLVIDLVAVLSPNVPRHHLLARKLTKKFLVFRFRVFSWFCFYSLTSFRFCSKLVLAALKSVPPSGTSPGFGSHESEVDRARYDALMLYTCDVAVTLFVVQRRTSKM
jgi:hypothetical protein